LINHIFLPPKLPEGREKDSNKLQSALAQFVYNSANNYVQFLPSHEQLRWDPILRMLKNIAALSDSTTLSELSVEKCIKDMTTSGVSIHNTSLSSPLT
jgi:hypothetical protein